MIDAPPRPLYSIGHSLGEITALAAAGACDDAAAVRLATLRGQAMAGLELDDPGKEYVELSADRRTLTIKVNTVEALDQVRVLLATAPEGLGEVINCNITVQLDGFIRCFYKTILERSAAQEEVNAY
ncbi:hypothetical protein EHM76_03435, partial [bacterium]